MSLTGRHAILQIHPTRRCNLACLHCYSASGPDAREEIPAQVMHGVIDDSVALGYDVLSVSGGEPLLYRDLPDLLAHARTAGMQTLVTTNGTLNTDTRLARLAPHLDLLAMSLDGPAEDHDRMRARSGAFAALRAGLPAVRRSGIPFGFLVTLTQHNVHQLDWAAHFAVAEGASLLQVHPLEATGRGQELAREVPDEIEGCYAALEVARLRAALGERLHIQLDLATRSALAAGLAAFADAPGSTDFAHQVSPLVLEPDGTCTPFEYGFPRAYALGNVLIERLALAADRWRTAVLPKLCALCRQVMAELSAGDAPPVSYWYSALSAACRRANGEVGTVGATP